MKNFLFYVIQRHFEYFSSLTNHPNGLHINRLEKLKYQKEKMLEYYLFGFALPQTPKQLINSRTKALFTLTEYHLSVFSETYEINDGVSVYHFTAFFECDTDKSKKYKIHIYFNESHDVLSEFKLFQCTNTAGHSHCAERELDIEKYPFTKDSRAELINFAWHYIDPILQEISNQKNKLLKRLSHQEAVQRIKYNRIFWNVPSPSKALSLDYRSELSSVVHNLVTTLSELAMFRKLYKSEISDLSHFKSLLISLQKPSQSVCKEESICSGLSKRRDTEQYPSQSSSTVSAMSATSPLEYTQSLAREDNSRAIPSLPTLEPQQDREQISYSQFLNLLKKPKNFEKFYKMFLERAGGLYLLVKPFFSLSEIYTILDFNPPVAAASSTFYQSEKKYSLLEYYVFRSIVDNDLRLFKLALNFVEDYNQPIDLPYFGKQKIFDTLVSVSNFSFIRYFVTAKKLSSVICIGTESFLYNLLVHHKNHCRSFAVIMSILLGRVDQIMSIEQNSAVRQLKERRDFEFFLLQFDYIVTRTFGLSLDDVISLVSSISESKDIIKALHPSFYGAIQSGIGLCSHLIKFYIIRTRLLDRHNNEKDRLALYNIVPQITQIIMPKLLFWFEDYVVGVKRPIVYTQNFEKLMLWRSIYSIQNSVFMRIIGILQLKSLQHINKIFTILSALLNSMSYSKFKCVSLEDAMYCYDYIFYMMDMLNKTWANLKPMFSDDTCSIETIKNNILAKANAISPKEMQEYILNKRFQYDLKTLANPQEDFSDEWHFRMTT